MTCGNVVRDTKKGQAENIAMTSSSTPSRTKSSANSSPACQMLMTTENVEKFVYETDKPQSAVAVCVDLVSVRHFL